MQHTKEQNWFAVGLDIIVVIVGIFLGLQVSDWSDQLKQKQTEKKYLERLIEEAETSIKIHNFNIDIHNRAVIDGIELIAILSDEERCEAEQSKFITLMASMTAFPPSRISLSTIEELYQSGEMKLIQSQSIRNEMTNIWNELKFLQLQWNRYRDFKTDIDKKLFSVAGYVATDTNLFSELGEFEAIKGYLQTPEALCGNYNLIGQMSGEQTTHQSYVYYINNFGGFLEQLHNQLLSYKKSLN